LFVGCYVDTRGMEQDLRIMFFCDWIGFPLANVLSIFDWAFIWATLRSLVLSRMLAGGFLVCQLSAVVVTYSKIR
jgi:hypothetical protein